MPWHQEKSRTDSEHSDDERQESTPHSATALSNLPLDCEKLLFVPPQGTRNEVRSPRNFQKGFGRRDIYGARSRLH